MLFPVHEVSNVTILVGVLHVSNSFYLVIFKLSNIDTAVSMNDLPVSFFKVPPEFTLIQVPIDIDEATFPLS